MLHIFNNKNYEFIWHIGIEFPCISIKSIEKIKVYGNELKIISTIDTTFNKEKKVEYWYSDKARFIIEKLILKINEG